MILDQDIELTRLVNTIARSTSRTQVLELSFRYAAAKPLSSTPFYSTGYRTPEEIVLAKVREITADDVSLTLASLMEIADLSQPSANEPRETGSGLSGEARDAWRAVLASDEMDTDLTRLNAAYETIHRATSPEMKACAAFAALVYAEKLGTTSRLAQMHTLNVAIFAAQAHNSSLAREAARISDSMRRHP
jgi:hypothetical protein